MSARSQPGASFRGQGCPRSGKPFAEYIGIGRSLQEALIENWSLKIGCFSFPDANRKY
jgi:hypothetical protein